MSRHTQRSIEGQGLYVQMCGDSKEMNDRFLLSFTLPVIYHWNGTRVGQFLARCSLFHSLNNYSWVFIASSKFTTNISYQVEVKPDLKKQVGS